MDMLWIKYTYFIVLLPYVWPGKQFRSSETPIYQFDLWPFKFKHYVFSQYLKKNWEIGTGIVLETAKKSYMSFHFMPWPLTLDDPKRSILLNYAIRWLIMSRKAYFNQNSPEIWWLVTISFHWPIWLLTFSAQILYF